MADPKSAARILGGGKAEAMFVRGYRDLVSLPSALEGYKMFFHTLADGALRPLLFHCTTGKDRTGWAAAVLLTVLGVRPEYIHAAFEEVQSRFGSMDNYLSDGLRLNHEMQSHIRDVLTEVAI
ncbi:tyrosine phosphatase family protein [Rhizobium subbaraonis]|uniref:Tyrosine phosphatase family protein n=1 Tax=Rhizobium subbaraonis TaxID=908946 RepID=A0A285UZX7_9HYPH|nr:tyrosine-protein phosphatase [Rhizobium subbaraonis]SOC47343.1 tyrosine phosphatase family protein [Rhizobium subbaraonis]